MAGGLGVAQSDHGKFGALCRRGGGLKGAAVEIAVLQGEDFGKENIGTGEVGLFQGQAQVITQGRGFWAVVGGGGGLGEEVAVAGGDLEQAGGNGFGLDAGFAKDAEEAEHLLLRGAEAVFQGGDGGRLLGVQARERSTGFGKGSNKKGGELIRQDAVDVPAGGNGSVVGGDNGAWAEHAGIRASEAARS